MLVVFLMYNNDINEYFRQCHQIKETFYTSFFKFYFMQEREREIFPCMLKKKRETMSFVELSGISKQSLRSKPLPFDEQSRGS